MPSGCPSQAEEAEGGLGWQRRGLPRWYCTPHQSLLHSHPTRAELFPSSKIPLLPHCNPRTSENKEEMLPAQPGLDRAGLGTKARTGRGLPTGPGPTPPQSGSHLEGQISWGFLSYLGVGAW